MAENVYNVGLSDLIKSSYEALMEAYRRGYSRGEAMGGGCREECGEDDVIRWIPTKEKLPPVGARVLTCDDEGNIYSSLEYEDDGWHWTTDRERRLIVNIIAWMPLPKPYKAEEDKPKTRAEKFYEIFPRCRKREDEDTSQIRPAFCWESLVGGSQGCSHLLEEECYRCWNKPYDGEFEEEEDER